MPQIIITGIFRVTNLLGDLSLVSLINGNLNKESAPTPRYSSCSRQPSLHRPFPRSRLLKATPCHTTRAAAHRLWTTWHSEFVIWLLRTTLPFRSKRLLIVMELTSSDVASTLPHICAAPLQPRGSYTFFPPEYTPYYPGTPTGQRHKRS